MKFAPKHVVAMVACVSAAVVLAPVGVMAATGTLVNITDPETASRQAQVGDRGTLMVESRAGSIAGSFSNYRESTNLTHLKLGEAVSPERLAITEVSAGSHGPTSAATYGHNYVDIVAYTQVSGTHSCGMPSAYVDYATPPGYTRKVLRRLVLRNQTPSIQTVFSGPPLVVPPAAAGKRTCVQLEVSLLSTETKIFMGGTGYRFK